METLTESSDSISVREEGKRGIKDNTEVVSLKDIWDSGVAILLRLLCIFLVVLSVHFMKYIF